MGVPLVVIHVRLFFFTNHPAIGVPPWLRELPYHSKTTVFGCFFWCTDVHWLIKFKVIFVIDSNDRERFPEVKDEIRTASIHSSKIRKHKQKKTWLHRGWNIDAIHLGLLNIGRFFFSGDSLGLSRAEGSVILRHHKWSHEWWVRIQGIIFECI